MQANHLFAEEALELRSIRMLLHDGVGPIKSGGQIYTGEVTVEFCVHAKLAMQRVKECNL